VSARGLVLLALALGGLALALCPAPHRWVGLAQLAAVAGAALWGPRSAERWALANATFIVALAILVAVRLPLVLAASLVLAWLAVHRAWTAQQRSALQIALLLAALECIVCTRLGPPPGLGWLFGALMLIGPAALARIQQRGPAPLLLAVGLGTVSLGAGWLVPLRGASLPPAARAIGFSRDIGLGDLGPLHDDPTLLVTLETDATLPEEVYLRGVVLDRFTGSGWAATAPTQAAPRREPPDVPAEIDTLILAPLTDGVLLGRAPVLHATADSAREVWVDLFGTWRYAGAEASITYQTHTGTTQRDEPLLSTGRWLGLPVSLDPRIRSLAAQLKSEAPPEREAAIAYTVDWLRSHYTYTRLPEPSTAHQALSTFLFSSQQGHCEYFATALAVLLRAQGIEARVVTGVRGGEIDGEQRVFRQRDAHAWVEAHLAGQGWVAVDATPPDLRAPPPLPEGKRASVVGSAAGSARPGRVLGVLVVVAGLAGIGWGWRARQGTDPLLRRYRKAQALVARRGWAIPDALPPAAAGQWLVARAGDAGQPLAALAALLYRSRYGGERAATLLDEADVALRRLRRLPRRG